MIEAGYFWTNIILLALGTLAIRSSIILMSSRLKISNRTKELFTFIPPAVFPAFIAPAIYFHQGHVQWALGKERAVVLVLAGIVCYFTRSTIATIGVGLISLYLITQVW